MQKKIVIRAIAGGVCLMALSGAAFAQSLAYTNQPVDVYAGPSGDYPVAAQVPPGAQLTVYGCVSDYSWCDVEASGLRGWVYGGYLDYPYQGTEVPIMTYGVQIGLPIVAFSFGTYWDHYYRGQPWYHDRVVGRHESHAPAEFDEQKETSARRRQFPSARQQAFAGHLDCQTPELPRRWLSSKCVSIIPTASISACIVVGPTNEKPFLRSALLSAADSSETVGTSSIVRGQGVLAG
ncbi:SH3 domain-containing protein [Paraburkholderia sediminicola]